MTTVESDVLAWIVLQNGASFEGTLFGSRKATEGEFVFHTGLTGYQEILTDPSYHRQIVVMTYPEIGNTGINADDMESRKCWLSGFVVRSLSPVVSNWRANQSLDEWLQEQDVPGISGVDTRALTLELRNHGAMMGVIHDGTLEEAKAKAETLTGFEGEDLVAKVSCAEAYDWAEGDWTLQGYNAPEQSRCKIAVWDFGVKYNILRLLAENGAQVRVFPSTATAQDLLAWQPDGIMLSNGPGDPRAVQYIVDQIGELVGKQPIMGICFGHQLLGQALGCTIEKLDFGHHAANHPVRDERTGRVEITSQNHNYVVIPSAGFKITHVNLNDKSVEGFIDEQRAIYSIQYHPESSPGPWDSHGLFSEFLNACSQ